MIGAIENAMIVRLTAAQDSGALGYRLKKITTYGGEFAEGITAAAKGFPMILIAFSGGGLQKAFTTEFVYSAKFTVIVAAQNLRNEQAARHGAEGKVGSYQIVEDVLALLAGQDLGLDIDALKPGNIQILANDKSDGFLASLYGMEFTTSFSVGVAEPVPALDDFETFHANWDVPIHGNVTPPLPSDEDADATDHVTLETAP